MKKQKEKGKKASFTRKEDSSKDKDGPAATAEENQASTEQSEPGLATAIEDGKPEATKSDNDTSENQNDAPESSKEGPAEDSTVSATTPSKPTHNRQPSLSIQSRMRSTSFRRTSVSQNPISPSNNGPRSPTLPILSPEGDTVTDIYRKQASRLDELERENRRLAKEATGSSTRWKSMESELE